MKSIGPKASLEQNNEVTRLIVQLFEDRGLDGVSDYIKTLLDDADAGAARTTLGLVIGTNVQAFDSELSLLAALNTTPFGRGLLELANAAALLSALTIAYGTWTPTLTNTTNIDSSSANACIFIRVGDRVFVAGSFTADHTAGAPTGTVMGMSLPIASNFGAGTDAGGSVAAASGPTQSMAGGFIADAANDRLTFNWTSNTTANLSMRFSGAYTVI